MKSLALLVLAAAALVCYATADEQQKLEILRKIHDNPGFSDYYVDLGNILDDDEAITLLPKKLNRVQAYIAALTIDPKNAVAYNNLGVLLPDLEATHEFPDGGKLNKQELFLKALEANPEFGHSYNNLAETMEDDQKVNYPDGKQHNKKDLFIRSIELDPTYPYAYNNLAVMLVNEGLDPDTKQFKTVSLSLTVAEGQGPQEYTVVGLLSECIRLSPHPVVGQCANNLVNVMEELRLKSVNIDGKEMTISDLKSLIEDQ
jgi:tetratricopeptide (TPR) repeat protein